MARRTSPALPRPLLRYRDAPVCREAWSATDVYGSWGHIMVVDWVLAAAGLVLLTFAADHLVLGSSRIAGRLRISPVVVGVVVIGLGTSAPEFLVSGVAAARGDTGIAIGKSSGPTF